MYSEAVSLLGGNFQERQPKGPEKGDWIVSFLYHGTEIGYCGESIHVTQVCNSKEECLKHIEKWKKRAAKRALRVDIDNIRIFRLEEAMAPLKNLKYEDDRP